jgi:hypothetical protein
MSHRSSRKEQTMPKFMLILSARPGVWKDLSPEEIQRKVEKYHAWSEMMSSRRVSGERLTDEAGRTVSLRNGKLMVIDGPYADAKEVVGGFSVFRGESYDEMVKLVSACPMLDDWTVTIRQTDPDGCGGE